MGLLDDPAWRDGLLNVAAAYTAPKGQGTNAILQLFMAQQQQREKQKREKIQNEILKEKLSQTRTQNQAGERIAGLLNPNFIPSGDANLPYQDPNIPAGLLSQPSPKQNHNSLLGAYAELDPLGALKMKMGGAKIPAPFNGKSLDAQAYNKLAEYEKRKSTKETISPQLQYEYDLAKRHLMKPRIVGNYDQGFTQIKRQPLPSYGVPQAAAPQANNKPINQLTKPDRPLPFNAAKELIDRSAAANEFESLAATFKDNYGGYKAEIVGDAANMAIRNFGFGDPNQANWWQQYQERKNIIRNTYFGSALTATEKEEFDKAQINPGMTPTQIRLNLARQNKTIRIAAEKLARAAKASGYNEESINEAMGYGGSLSKQQLHEKYGLD